MKAKLTFIHALSPLHAGTGQGIGAIDLPIAREKATNIPYLPGSSVKGSLRDEFNPPKDERDASDDAERQTIKEQADLRNRIFGPEKLEGDGGYAGAIQFTDQTLLCLPVRSLAGTFAYVTSPYILKRFKRDFANLESSATLPDDVEKIEDDSCIVSSDVLKLLDDKVCLEDLDLTPTDDDAWAAWLANKIFPDLVDENGQTQTNAWRNLFAERFCIVSDNVFGFLLQTATEVTARIKLSDYTKTTETGMLWYEEALPTESILFGLALSFPNQKTGLTADEIFAHVAPKLNQTLQFGGNATVGRGLCRVSLFPKEVAKNGKNADS